MTRFAGWGLAAVLAAVALTQGISAQSDTVKGTATAGATKVALTNGMAVSYTAPNGQLISVLLSDKPADRKEFATDTKTGPREPLMSGLFEGAWKSQHIGNKLSGFVFTLDAEKKVIGEEFLIGGMNNTFSIGDEYVVEVKSTSPRLVGTIKTKTPIVDLGSTKAGLDATFDLAVEQRK